MFRWVLIYGFWYAIYDQHYRMDVQGGQQTAETEEAAAEPVFCSCEQPRVNETRFPEQAAGCMPSRPDQCR